MFEPKNFESLLGTPGFSDILLKNHFTLYQGYNTNTNKILEELALLSQSQKTNTPEFAELKRRFGWEFNGLRLHELYFDNLKNGESNFSANSALNQKIVAEFGDFSSWEKDFKTTGAMRGIGWVILYQDPVSDHLFNTWVNEHDTGHLAGANPLLVMDVFEHAFMLDYGLKRADYIEAFFKAIDWETAEKRLD